MLDNCADVWLLDDSQALQRIVDALHKAGIHHHDLREDNIVKGLADDGTGCDETTCPDYLWLNESPFVFHEIIMPILKIC